MKICLITEYFYPENTGGSPTVLSDLMRHLKDNYDIEIDVITSQNLYRMAQKKLAPFENWDGIRIFRVNSPRSNRPSSVMRIAAGLTFAIAASWKLKSLDNYDVVFVNTNPPAAPIAALAHLNRTRTPYIYLIHDLYPDLPIALGLLSEQSARARIARSFQRNWLHKAQEIIVQGRCTRNHLASVYGVPLEKIEVIPHWGDPENIYPMPKSSEFRKNNNLDGFVALYAGNFGPFQGLDVIMEAAQIIGQKRDDITFAIVGEGVRKDELTERIARENISNLKLFPAVDSQNYPDLLASADVSLVPLAAGVHGLAVPSKFYTVLASGRPTIAILDSESEISRVVNESGCGLQVDQDDPQGLAKAIIKLRESTEILETMGETARRVLEEKYTIGCIARKYYEAFVSAQMNQKNR